MVAEPGSVMTMDSNEQFIQTFQAAINPQGQAAVLVHPMVNNMHAGFQTFHDQVVDIIRGLGRATLSIIFRTWNKRRNAVTHAQE